jgi:hypothetical protein
VRMVCVYTVQIEKVLRMRIVPFFVVSNGKGQSLARLNMEFVPPGLERSRYSLVLAGYGKRYQSIVSDSKFSRKFKYQTGMDR